VITLYIYSSCILYAVLFVILSIDLYEPEDSVGLNICVICYNNCCMDSYQYCVIVLR